MKKILIIAISILTIVIAIGCAAKKVIKTDNLANATDTSAIASSDNQASTEKYNVVKGDCLWDISGKKEIYNDPFKWVLIYRANTEDISDPDIIEIGQELSIDRDCDIEDVETAIQIAKDMPPYQKKSNKTGE